MECLNFSIESKYIIKKGEHIYVKTLFQIWLHFGHWSVVTVVSAHFSPRGIMLRITGIDTGN